MPRTSSLRASDADRDAVADRLRQATLEGRLDAEEFEERLGAALHARTYGELRRLVSDLPSVRPRVSPFVIALKVLAALIVLMVAAVVLVMAAAWWVFWALMWFAFCRRRRGWALMRPPRRRPARHLRVSRAA
jgi:uncharacterized protein DUF1707